ncbi:helix-turn-helix domain-containing protein [Mangrovibacterium sp.]|uniref:helix-turn-helix domain-containing protein n=1 Tax=Mangrovibacterium sp. TaxID=1961364 RepID=UPI003565B79A
MTKLSPTKQEFLNKVKSIIEEHYTNEQFDASELAVKIGISRSKLNRRFKESVQMSARKYICRQRLIKARQLLEDSNLTIPEITRKVGFGSPVYFSKKFKKHFGYPPSKAKENAHLHWEEHVHHLEKKDLPPLIRVLIAIILLILVGLIVVSLLQTNISG